MSLASAEAAAARRRAASTVGYYNLKLGPTAWNFGAGLGVDYNSNVNYTESNPEGDFIFRPEIRTRMQWPVSEENSINLALGAGYSAYVQHSDLDRLYILPGTELSFDLYLSELWINLHDRFSITEYSYQNPGVAGSGDYSQLQNALGFTTVWDLNQGVARVGYDHVNYETISGGSSGTYAGQPSGYSEVFSASAGYYLKPGTLAGIGAGLVAHHLHHAHHQHALHQREPMERGRFFGHAGERLYPFQRTRRIFGVLSGIERGDNRQQQFRWHLCPARFPAPVK